MDFNSRRTSHFLLAALLAGGLSAQEYRGRVQGTVTDATRATIAGANVTLANVNTGVSSVRQSDERGHYLFDLVLPGSYTVTGTQASSCTPISNPMAGWTPPTVGPCTENNFKVNLEKAKSWISKGAQPSETVRSILKKAEKAATQA